MICGDTFLGVPGLIETEGIVYIVTSELISCDGNGRGVPNAMVTYVVDVSDAVVMGTALLPVEVMHAKSNRVQVPGTISN